MRISGRAGSASPAGPVSTARVTTCAVATEVSGPLTMNSARRAPGKDTLVGLAAPAACVPTGTPSRAMRINGCGTPS
eukprot:CAMPEP_0172170752 /NCGR_PEP_ID=MMETSP1050-20130122/11461_1 /TAXON_ID=233186 /ORGANISM="Cryptomonas curvata, Strain CCAP979/52" /LENGTH=76 /DNA_ID=CAMNT_0012842007 /DNA_START=286 /DNA_END=516 /DNA_ORIENTATION=+